MGDELVEGGTIFVRYRARLEQRLCVPGRAADDITQSFRREPNTATGPAPGEPAAAEPSVVDHEGRAKETDRRRAAFGYLLILVGVVFLLGNTGIFRAIQWQLVWPLVLVGIGILLLVQRVRQ